MYKYSETDNTEHMIVSNTESLPIQLDSNIYEDC